jgi:hypothetical protein
MSTYTQLYTVISTVIHTFSTSGGKGVKTDNPEVVIKKAWLSFTEFSSTLR